MTIPVALQVIFHNHHDLPHSRVFLKLDHHEAYPNSQLQRQTVPIVDISDPDIFPGSTDLLLAEAREFITGHHVRSVSDIERDDLVRLVHVQDDRQLEPSQGAMSLVIALEADWLPAASDVLLFGS